MRRLNGNDEALFFRGCVALAIGARCVVVPDRQIFQVFVGHVRVLRMRRVRKDLLLLLLETSVKLVELFFKLGQLLLVCEHLEVQVAHFRVDLLECVGGRVRSDGYASGLGRLFRRLFLLFSLLAVFFLLASASVR